MLRGSTGLPLIGGGSILDLKSPSRPGLLAYGDLFFRRIQFCGKTLYSRRVFECVVGQCITAGLVGGEGFAVERDRATLTRSCSAWPRPGRILHYSFVVRSPFRIALTASLEAELSPIA